MGVVKAEEDPTVEVNTAANTGQEAARSCFRCKIKINAANWPQTSGVGRLVLT